MSDRCKHEDSVKNTHWYCRDCEMTVAGKQCHAVPKDDLRELVEQWRLLSDGIVPSDNKQVVGQSQMAEKCADELEALLE